MVVQHFNVLKQEFRKNGFNDDDAATLGLVATQFQNIADEAISAGDSASFIISQLIAFNQEAEDATHIIDAVDSLAALTGLIDGNLLKSYSPTIRGNIDWGLE